MSNDPTIRVVRYDSQTGALLGTFVTAGSGGLSAYIRDLAFGKDGNLYLLDPNNGVLRYSGQDGHFISVFVNGAQIPSPQNFAFAPGGDLFVSTSTNGILRFNGATGAALGTFITPEFLGGPKGLAFNPENLLHVSSTGSNAVLRFDGSTGAFMDAFPLPANGPPSSAGPTFVAIYRPVTQSGVAPGAAPSLMFTRTGHNLVLSWPAGFTLQCSTHASGPFISIPSATSPCTNSLSVPQQFFRLIKSG
jgi:outer membrane protein assembly factor BamB